MKGVRVAREETERDGKGNESGDSVWFKLEAREFNEGNEAQNEENEADEANFKNGFEILILDDFFFVTLLLWEVDIHFGSG